MDRLTEWMGEHAAVVTHHENYIDRLAAYEDTGLTPEEIMSLYSRYSYDPDHAYAHYMKNLFPKMERAGELSKADAEERVLVLPCKVGDEVWRIAHYADRNELIRLEVREIKIVAKNNIVIRASLVVDDWHSECCELFEPRDIGKRYFLTREEAERKLEGK